jgi:hypothetical protein
MKSQGGELEAYVSRLGWSIEGSVVSIPPNPDNQIESTVVQESIKLPRRFNFVIQCKLILMFWSRACQGYLTFSPGYVKRRQGDVCVFALVPVGFKLL